MDNNTNPFQQIIQLLMHAAQARPDLAQTQPLAKFAGRVIQPGDDIHSALSRMPMGKGPAADPVAATGAMAAGAAPQLGYHALRALMASLAPSFNPAQAIGGAAGGEDSPGAINPAVRGNTLPSDPWGIQRQPATRSQPGSANNIQDLSNAGPGVQRIPDGSIALPRNPRDMYISPQQQSTYNGLPAGGRTQTVPEDIRRQGMGEVPASPLADQPPRSPSGTPATDLYSLWQELAKGLGIPTTDNGGFQLKQ